MNTIRLSRHALGLNQSDFGAWLGQRLNRQPYSSVEICRWETGTVSPRSAIRQSIAWIAAKELAKQVHRLTIEDATAILAECFE